MEEKEPKKEKPKEEVKKEEKPTEEKVVEAEKKDKTGEEKKADKPKEVVKPKEKPKKTEAIVNAKNLPISTKHSAAICRFIKNKKIGDAISDLEKVLKLKKSVPMKGEVPHRKGKGVMSGKFPKNAALRFITLLKTLSANSNYNGLDDPVIVECIANIGSRPYGRFGWVRKKRSHVRIVAKERKNKMKKKRK
jgi:ribosomal protein L22